MTQEVSEAVAPRSAIWRRLIEQWRAEATVYFDQAEQEAADPEGSLNAAKIDQLLANRLKLCADEAELALRACADALAPSPEKVQDDQSRSDTPEISPRLQSSAATDGVLTTPAPKRNESRSPEGRARKCDHDGVTTGDRVDSVSAGQGKRALGENLTVETSGTLRSETCLNAGAAITAEGSAAGSIPADSLTSALFQAVMEAVARNVAHGQREYLERDLHEIFSRADALAPPEPREQILLTALKRVTEHMDRSGGDGYGMPECPWCKCQYDGEIQHLPECELALARQVIADVEAGIGLAADGGAVSPRQKNAAPTTD